LVRVLGDELRHPPRQFEIIKFGMRWHKQRLFTLE
jgi:hypothetical protein